MKVDVNHRLNPDRVAARSAGPLAPARPTAPEFNLLNATCSAEVAKAALEKTFRGLSSLQKLMLSRQLGYDSFSSMLAASTVATLSDGSAWWLTADRSGAWTAWNLCQLDFQYGGESNSHAVRPRKPR